jgi:peptide-methionine (S)-S-oxide reductase
MNDATETAILAGGCFWPAQELLRQREGVVSATAGYTGGENENPTDEDHPGHAEAVEVVFDPTRLSYRELLEFYFQIHRHDLTEEVVGNDYRSEIFYLTDEQRRIAEETIPLIDRSDLFPGKVVTKVTEAGPFWAAEEGDQEYLRRYPEGSQLK